MAKEVRLNKLVESDLLDLLAADIDAYPEKLHYPSQEEIKKEVDEIRDLTDGLVVDIDTLEPIDVDTADGVSN
jgi:hypothetical protein